MTVLELEDLRLQACKVLKNLYYARFTDDKMGKLVRQNKGGTFHLSAVGHEMIGVAFGARMLACKDWAFPYYRDRAFVIAIGSPLFDLFGAFLARELGAHSGGRMMPEHYSDTRLRIPVQSSCVGSQFLQAVGVAKAIQLQGKKEVVYVSAGDGATSQGDFHEALNFSAIHRLPIVFVIQDNEIAISVPAVEQTAGGSISPLTRSYEGLSSYDVDGCDYEGVQIVVDAVLERARAGLGPSVVVAKVPRIGAHSSSDDPSKYKSQESILEEKQKDPLPRMEQWILSKGFMTLEELDLLKKQTFQEVEAAALAAEELPFPLAEQADRHVFKQDPFLDESLDVEGEFEESIVMVDAINHTLEEAMDVDPRIVVFGQDVAHGKGGVFGATRHLTATFGSGRCFNTPLAESSIVGIAIGMSFAGLRPVAEIQFADYMWTGVNQLMNELASIHYRSNGQWSCPVIIRMPYGGYIQGGPYHSQSVEAYLAHCPGLQVVIPSNAADAKKLLNGALKSSNPTIFLEHKALYRQRVFCARKEPEEGSVAPLGKASIIKEGSDVTVVCYGMLAFLAVQSAERLQKEGIFVEVIDLRTIVPLDEETIINSIRKTGKCLVAHEASLNNGFGAEIVARIMEKGFTYLDAPVKRLAGKNCMVPYSKVLEDSVLPQAADLDKALRELKNF